MYQKVYHDAVSESNARYYYAYNKNMIDNHNNLYDRGQKTFKLAPNQFTDMRLIHFNALFPVASPLATSYASPAPVIGTTAPPTYDPAVNFGYMFTAEDQGITCNSGWAYAAVKAIEILDAQQRGTLAPPPLSSQNIIDCSGRTTACTNQVPQTAFDYLKLYDMPLYVESDYNNNNTLTEPGMCTPRGNTAIKLAQYSILNDSDDESLRRYVGHGFPVVVEIDPTSFEFMHYSSGIYQPPTTSTTGSHFLTVRGYGKDLVSNLDYWILQNSFGTTWGEGGLIRILMSPAIKLTKNAILPTVLS